MRRFFDRPIVVTNVEFRFAVAEQIHAVGCEADIVLEPQGRDSGPAIAVAAEYAHRHNSSAVLLVLAADHVMHDADAFQQACKMRCRRPSPAGS